MIKKQLTMIYDKGIPGDTDLNTICFDSWKKLHMFIFENGLFTAFEVYLDGLSVLRYSRSGGDTLSNILYFSDDVPGSVLFEIVNRHASAHL